MKFKLFLLPIIGLCLLGPINANAASTNTFTNKNGIKLTAKEYKFVNEFYGNEFFSVMTTEDYEWIKDLNINTSEVEIQSTSEFGITPFGSSFETPSKKITIAKSCTTICTILVNAKWSSNPTIRSYDLIGARLHNTSLANQTITTKVVSSAGTETFNNTRLYTNGFGTAVKLPTSATAISIQQKFYTKTGGTVFASYQHATQNISLVNSQNYTISNAGYGKVFAFYGAATGIYDAMNGVTIDV